MDKPNLVDLAAKVQELLLDDFLRILTPHTNGIVLASPTDRATIARFLKDNNYNVDANTIPQSLRDMVERVRVAHPLPAPETLPVHATVIEP